MKNILLFAGHNATKRGGMADFVADFDSAYDAKKFIEAEVNQHMLLDTLPSIQWAHLYNDAESRIFEKGTVEIWGKEDVGNIEEDEDTAFSWIVSDEKDYKPLIAQASYSLQLIANAKAEEIRVEAEKQFEIDNIVESLDNTIIRKIDFDLTAVAGSIMDGMTISLEFAFDLVAMQQESEIDIRHVKILSSTINDEDAAYIKSIGGPSAVSHWLAETQKYFVDNKIMEVFKDQVLVDAELNHDAFAVV